MVSLIVLCFRQALRRQREIEREPSVFDFAKYSYFDGHIWPWLHSFTFKGKRVNMRQVEILIEPALFFCIGTLMLISGQYIGMVLMCISLVMSWQQWMFYRAGDQALMDIIDTMLVEKSLIDLLFSPDEDATSESKVRILGRYPKDPGKCRQNG